MTDDLPTEPTLRQVMEAITAVRAEITTSGTETMAHLDRLRDSLTTICDVVAGHRREWEEPPRQDGDPPATA